MDQADAKYVVEVEIEKALSRPLTIASLDMLYKLITVNSFLEERAESTTDTKNQKYDRDINVLFYDYLKARKAGKKETVIEKLSYLLDELSDIVVEIYDTAMCCEERNIIENSVKKMQIR